jgi:thiol-disulfide isomerase/thioredoxin
MIRQYAARALALLCVLGLLAGTALAEATPRKDVGGGDGTNPLIAVGSDPILFELEDLNDNVVALKDMLGKEAVVIVFWSLFCGPCQEELPLVDAVGVQYAEQGLKTYTINLDGKKRGKAVKKYMQKKGYTFGVLWEEIEGISYVTADAYGVGGTPTTIIIDKTGKVSYTHVGQVTKEELESTVKKALGI